MPRLHIDPAASASGRIAKQRVYFLAHTGSAFALLDSPAVDDTGRARLVGSFQKEGRSWRAWGAVRVLQVADDHVEFIPVRAESVARALAYLRSSSGPACAR